MAQADNTGFNLTKATKAGRIFVKVGIITLGVLMVGRISLNAFTAYWKATHPPAPPPPAMEFGLLPALQFPDEDLTKLPKSYVLETASGKLPQFGDRALVYFMPKRTPSLLDADRAKVLADKLGFKDNPETIDPRTYRWRKLSPLQSVLEMNIVNHNFEYKTNYLSRPDLILNVSVPVEYDAVQIVKSFISSPGLLPADMATASGKVSYLKAVAGELQPANSPSDADFVRVDINRNPIQQRYRTYTPDGETGVIHAILPGTNKGIKIVHYQLQYYPVDYLIRTTYPLKSATEAWQLMQAGEGYVAHPASRNTETAVIREVELGYYDSFLPQDYLQPIYVFKGDDGFLGYVPALTANSTESVQ